MPNYFSDYDTTVHFISEEEMKRDHSGLAHGGFVIRSGKTGTDGEHNHIFELALTLIRTRNLRDPSLWPMRGLPIVLPVKAVRGAVRPLISHRLISALKAGRN